MKKNLYEVCINERVGDYEFTSRSFFYGTENQVEKHCRELEKTEGGRNEDEDFELGIFDGVTYSLIEGGIISVQTAHGDIQAKVVIL